MNWHSLDIDKIFSLMGSSPTGLSPHLVEQKQAECGPNELEEKKKKPAWVIFMNQFKDFMILVLIAAAVISGVVGEMADAIIILVIVILNAVFTTDGEFIVADFQASNVGPDSLEIDDNSTFIIKSRAVGFRIIEILEDYQS